MASRFFPLTANSYTSKIIVKAWSVRGRATPLGEPLCSARQGCLAPPDAGSQTTGAGWRTAENNVAAVRGSARTAGTSTIDHQPLTIRKKAMAYLTDQE